LRLWRKRNRDASKTFQTDSLSKREKEGRKVRDCKGGRKGLRAKAKRGAILPRPPEESNEQFLKRKQAQEAKV